MFYSPSNCRCCNCQNYTVFHVSLTFFRCEKFSFDFINTYSSYIHIYIHSGKEPFVQNSVPKTHSIRKDQNNFSSKKSVQRKQINIIVKMLNALLRSESKTIC